jgi:hypothetical protein
MRFRHRHGASVTLVIAAALLSSEARAGTLALFRYEDQAQQHCPSDSVVWLDFKKGRYYSQNQKLYGSGYHGSFVCRGEARRSLYRRALLGLR